MVEEANVPSADSRNYQTSAKVSIWYRPEGSIVDADWIEFGNIIEPDLTPTIEKLEHQSNRRGLRTIDREATISRKLELNFKIDEINHQNLLLAFQGVDQGAASVDAHDSADFTNPGAGNTIDLGQTGLKAGSVTVRGVVDGETTIYEEGVDYSVDDATGILTIEYGGDLADESAYGVEEIHVTWAKTLSSRKMAGFSAEINGEVKLQNLPPGGHQAIIVLPNCTINNNGAFALGDGSTWQEISLTVVAMEDNAGELCYVNEINKADRV
jgi:hypothetical protein